MKSRIFVNNQQNNGNHKWSCLKGSSIWLDFFHCCYSHMNSIERKSYEQHEDSSSFQFSFGSSSMNSVCLWRIALFPFAWFDIWFYQSTTYHSRNGWAYNTLLLLLHTIGIGRKNLWSILQCCCLIGVESLLPTSSQINKQYTWCSSSWRSWFLWFVYIGRWQYRPWYPWWYSHRGVHLQWNGHDTPHWSMTIMKMTMKNTCKSLGSMGSLSFSGAVNGRTWSGFRVAGP